MSDKDQPEQHDIAPSSEIITPAPSLAPVAPNQRINALDILRGFALLGILLMNIEWFGRPISNLGGFNPDLTGLDHAAGWLVRCFVEGKFYKLFALLFGMGFAVMLTQAMDKGRPFGAWFTRRMFVLFVFGLLHMFFLWQGDILHDYAFAGLLMLGFIYLLRKKRFQKFNNPSSILKLALWWLSIPMLMASFAGVGFGVFLDRQSVSEQWQERQEIRVLVSQLEADAEAKALLSPEVVEPEISEELPKELTNEVQEQADPELVEEDLVESEEIELTPQEQAQQIFESEQEHEQSALDEIAALRDGSYWQATVFRAKASMMWLIFTPIFALTLLLPIFLLGYWLVVSGAIKDHAQYPKLFGYMARIGLGVGLFVTVGGLVIIGHPAVEHIQPIQAVGNVLFNGGQFFMAAGYLGLLIRLLDSPKWQKLLAKLAPMGRMALTNYIMHSIILSSLFYGYAGGLYGEVSRASQMLIVLAIVIIQIPLSSWWLKHYQFGPLEWLWRSLTYKKWQSFKVLSVS
ncbi:DUF418 domain-containing protein [uncultured Paraglaciecola sp.]|uniref:DUF418 domain-containing protein n=1 Tax=uncultured Paraglaciecola sp. TaxID=1765024 RepID=UPI0030DBE67F|tara:strand:+ start:26060 stop:27610 length:1551 start_codon:yes stop_codon:yes gene_type:complete